MEQYFSKFREGIIGYNHEIKTPIHKAIRMVYADWTASGRMYRPIEEMLLNKFYPLVANTHTEANFSAAYTTFAYYRAREVIKDHVEAEDVDDILISCNSGMTGVVNKLQRILGLKINERYQSPPELEESEKPVVFVTHMEHHSNHTSWMETIADVVVVPKGKDGLVSVDHFKAALKRYEYRTTKIVAITACSNVTGIMTPYMDIAEITHQYGGVCFVDFACSAPYVDIHMHPDDAKGRYLDAIYFSPHKFLGGPGSTGILIFNRKLYANAVPDHPGGGTVDWTDPWGGRKYLDDPYLREDGGTPAFLQTMRAALSIRLKEEMGVGNMQKREEEILDIIWKAFAKIPNLHVLAGEHKKRLGVVSFNIEGLYYNLGVRILNDRFGIQTRGGCACAGTYGHDLLKLDYNTSSEIYQMILRNNFSKKPGWIRMSIHPTHTDAEIHYMMDAIRQLAQNHEEWAKEYRLERVRESIKPRNMISIYETNSEINKCFEKPMVDRSYLNPALSTNQNETASISQP